jgi:hypothetical protein
MGRYRKKPVVIDAWQNVPGISDMFPDWMKNGSITSSTDGSLNIVTLEGIMRADPGDWIIRGVKGELYPCKPDIFAATYEPETQDVV